MLTSTITKEVGSLYDGEEPDSQGRTTHITVDLGNPDHSPYQVVLKEAIMTDDGSETMRLMSCPELEVEFNLTEDSAAGRGWVEAAAVEVVLDGLKQQAQEDQDRHAGDDLVAEEEDEGSFFE